MSWLYGPMIALDTETTGTDPFEDEPLQVCVGWSAGPGDWSPDVLWMPTSVPIQPGAAAVHGLDIETVRARADGATMETQLDRIYAALADAAQHGHPIVGHNLRFDLTLLHHTMQRHMGGTYGVPDGLLILDTLVLWRRFDQLTGSRTLSALAGQYGIEFPAHDAGADALASLRLLHIIAARTELLEHVSLDTLTGMQADWWRGQENAAVARAAGNGRPRQPEQGWPLAVRHG